MSAKNFYIFLLTVARRLLINTSHEAYSCLNKGCASCLTK